AAELCRRDATNRDQQADVVEWRVIVIAARLLLRMNAQMIDMVLLAHVGAGLEERTTQAATQLAPHPADAAVLDQESQASANAREPAAVVAEDAGDLGTD